MGRERVRGVGWMRMRNEEEGGLYPYTYTFLPLVS